MKIKLKIVPGSSRDSIGSWMNDALKVKVQAPPEHGKANAAVEKLMARKLGLAGTQVKIVAGFTASAKVMEIEGIEPKELNRILGQPA